MFRIILFLVMLSGTVFAQAANPWASFKKEAPTLQSAVHDAVSSAVPGRGLLQAVKVTYLEGYGVVVTLEAALEEPRNIFSANKSPAEVRTIVTERRRLIEQKLEALLKEKALSLTSLAAGESIAVVIHLFNSYPVDLPDLPTQLIFTVKKQDPIQVNIRAF